MKLNLTYHTKRLSLRPTNIEDAAFVLELLNSPKWLEFIGDRNVKSLKDAKTYIQDIMLPVLKKNGFGNFTVIRKEDGAKIGCCGLYDREGVEGFDLGFAFLPDFENLGYGFESASKIKSAAVSDFNLKHISAITNPENIDSQRLLEKLDFKFQKNINLPGSRQKLMLYRFQHQKNKTLL